MSRKNAVQTALVSLALLLASSVAYAGPLYDINRIIGGGSVVGSIETDGTIGSLGVGRILDWNLTLNDGISLFTLLGPLSGNNSALSIAGSSFTASAIDLQFDFSNVSADIVVFQNPNLGSGMNLWCMEGALNTCAGNASAETVRVCHS